MKKTLCILAMIGIMFSVWGNENPVPKYHSRLLANGGTHIWIASHNGLVHYDKATEK